MASEVAKWNRPALWVEIFAAFNLAGLAPDIFLAHSTNLFRHWVEYIPLVFSAASPLISGVAVWGFFQRDNRSWPWRYPGYALGWTSVVIGIAGLILHLESQFFQRWTLASLVYAAPFAAPLAYTGIGLVLIMNRMVDSHHQEWAQWVIFLALGGFVGNFIFSVTDHAQNGFFHASEWIPVVSSALAVGFLLPPLWSKVSRGYLRLSGGILLLQALTGLVGFALHLRADWFKEGPSLFDRLVYGAPVFAPMLFPDLVLLAGIGLLELYRETAANTGND